MSYYGRRGDPGFLGNFFGDVRNIFSRQVVPTVRGYVTGGFGGVIGALASSRRGGGGSMGAGMGPAMQMNFTGAAAMGAAGAVARGAGRMAGRFGQMITALPGGGTMTSEAPSGGGAASAAGGVARGYHIIKKGPHAGGQARNRRMNVCNPRALRRAIRRGHGFVKLASRTIRFVSPQKKAKRFGGFKARKKH